MIEIYVGKPGSGKSLHSARDIINVLRFGGHVISNFDINTDKLKLKQSSQVSVIDNKDLNVPNDLIRVAQDFLVENPKKKTLIVLDECQLIFDARQWNISGRSEWLNFFAQHRKLNAIKTHDNIRIILVTQDEGCIDKRIRKLSEYLYLHRDISKFGYFGFFLCLILGCNIFRYSTYWLSSKKAEYVDGGYYIAGKKVTSLYNTLNTFGV